MSGSVISKVSQMFSLKAGCLANDKQNMALLALAFLCATAPFELHQLFFALVGAVGYALVQAVSPNFGVDSIRPRKASPSVTYTKAPRPRMSTKSPPSPHSPNAQWRAPSKVNRTATPVPHQDIAQPSARPIVPPTFTGVGWDAEVQELIGQISPTPEGDKVVQQLAQSVKRTLSRIIPDVQVVGFASGDLLRGLAFGVAVPEVDIVVSVQPQALVARLHPHSPNYNSAGVDARKLQKSAIRMFTDKLVSSSGFKFRRSAFRGQEPKVTLLVPAELGIHSSSIPIDLSVNSTTPLCAAALLTECGQMEPRAKELILFVRRWAKDRGVCHAAKGHLSPYLWNLLTIYFLQVGVEDEGPLLPPLEDFKASSGLLGSSGIAAAAPGASATKSTWKPPMSASPKKTVGSLFKEFIRFYSKVFDWRNEAVSIRLARRAPPDVQLPLHIVVHDDGSTTEVGPSIEDPFDNLRNLGVNTNAESLSRMREELLRADELCSCDASLTVLLEPWVPPERCGAEKQAEEIEEKA